MTLEPVFLDNRHFFHFFLNDCVRGFSTSWVNFNTSAFRKLSMSLKRSRCLLRCVGISQDFSLLSIYCSFLFLISRACAFFSRVSLSFIFQTSSFGHLSLWSGFHFSIFLFLIYRVVYIYLLPLVFFKAFVVVVCFTPIWEFYSFHFSWLNV